MGAAPASHPPSASPVAVVTWSSTATFPTNPSSPTPAVTSQPTPIATPVPAPLPPQTQAPLLQPPPPPAALGNPRIVLVSADSNVWTSTCRLARNCVVHAVIRNDGNGPGRVTLVIFFTLQPDGFKVGCTSSSPQLAPAALGDASCQLTANPVLLEGGLPIAPIPPTVQIQVM
jgi:hypothetical protein